MDQWGKIRSGLGSWHAVRTFTRVSGGAIFLCGRSTAGSEFRPEPPWEGKSCETCLRIKERQS